MSKNGSDHKEAVQDVNLDVEDAIEELRYRPACKLEDALSVYSGVQRPAWRQYQDTLCVSRLAWDRDCGEAYKRRDTAIAAAWDKYQSVSEGAWETYQTGISFYDNKLRFIKHYTWKDYAADTSAVWRKYALETFPAYNLYSTVHEEACHQLDFITTDATLRCKREARAAWTKYQSIENPAWVDLHQVRKELRSVPDLSLERFEE